MHTWGQIRCGGGSRPNSTNMMVAEWNFKKWGMKTLKQSKGRSEFNLKTGFFLLTLDDQESLLQGEKQFQVKAQMERDLTCPVQVSC